MTPREREIVFYVIIAILLIAGSFVAYDMMIATGPKYTD